MLGKCSLICFFFKFGSAHGFTFMYPALRCDIQLTDVTDTNRHSTDSWTTHQWFVCLVGDFLQILPWESIGVSHHHWGEYV